MGVEKTRRKNERSSKTLGKVGIAHGQLYFDNTSVDTDESVGKINQTPEKIVEKEREAQCPKILGQ